MAQYFDGESAKAYSATVTYTSKTYHWITEKNNGHWPENQCNLDQHPDGRVTLIYQSESLILDDQEWKILRPHFNKNRISINQKIAFYLLGIIVIGLMGVILYPFFTEWMISRIPLEKEAQWLQQIIKSDVNIKLKDKAEPAIKTDLIDELIAKLHPSIKISTSLDPQSEPNAFALPGVHITVTHGMICFVDGPEELIVILAHEVEHIEKRHVLKSLIQRTGLSIIRAILLGSSGGGNTGADFAQWLLLNHYSVADETEADQGAVERLLKYNIDPKHGALFFEKIIHQKGRKILEFIVRTHPPSGERINYFKSHTLSSEVKTEPLIDPDKWNQLLTQLKCAPESHTGK